MKKTLLSLALLLAATLAIDRLGARLMDRAQQHSNDLFAPKLRALARTARPDILMLGTSRCLRHYVPHIIADSTALSTYNGGLDACRNIYAHYLALHLMLSHHTPRVVCLDVSEMDFIPEAGATQIVTFFAPYFGQSPQADSLYRQLNLYWPYRLSHLYRHNAHAITTLSGLRRAQSIIQPDGYVSNDDLSRHPHTLTQEATIPHVDPHKIRLLQRFIADCHSRGITLVMTISPAYSHVSPDYYAPLHRLARQHHVPLLDYHTPGLYADRPDLFYDNIHLNAPGAQAFTRLFAHDLKKILEERPETNRPAISGVSPHSTRIKSFCATNHGINRLHNGMAAQHNSTVIKATNHGTEASKRPSTTLTGR